jgi:hypothetical protein
LFNVPQVERLLQLNARGRNLDLQLWTILSLELWCRRFLDRSPNAHSAAAKSLQPIAVAGMS